MSKVSRRHMTGLCHYKCDNVATTWDHIIPREFGGPRGINLVKACRKCNRTKDNKPPTCLCERCRKAVQSWRRIQYPKQLKKYPEYTAKGRRLRKFYFELSLIYYEFNSSLQ